jgi:pimeloyl-ACP methyl ester carboxylesterase
LLSQVRLINVSRVSASGTTMTPRDLFVDVRGLRLHVAEWGDGAEPVLLLHGHRDHARLFDGLARRLLALDPGGRRLLALDFRGHGDSDHLGAGGTYRVADHVADAYGVITRLAARRAAIVGHSLGGGVGLQLAGAIPEAVSRLALIDAVGPPAMAPDVVPRRLREFVEDIERLWERAASRHATVEEAAARVRERHPGIRPDDALHYARHGTRPAEGGGVVWKYDPRLRARNPEPFVDVMVAPFLDRVTAPVLSIEPADRPLLDEETRARRLGRLARAEQLRVPGAGHHVHLDAPDLVAERLDAFLRAP